MKEKLSLLAELIKLAKSDNNENIEEFEFLKVIASQLGITKADFEELFHKYIEFAPPKFEFDRILQFHRLVLLMNIDKNISEEELQFVRDIGIKMGLNPAATEKVLEVMHQYPDKMVPPDVLIGIFTQFYN